MGPTVIDLVRKILSARVYEVAQQTPLDRMGRMSARLGSEVLLKREDLQPIHSFKIRGAYNRIVQLSDAERRAGVICASAGNHAQGVALAARQLGLNATVVMPVTTPNVKVSSVRHLGGDVVLHGDNFDDAYLHARQLEREHGLTFVHPFDDEEVIAGQGTIASELLHQHPDPIAAIFVPVGGGGLAAGIAPFVKFLRPETKVIGVEPTDSAAMQAALAAGEPVQLGRVGNFADGVAVRQVGNLTHSICAAQLDGIITVNTDAMSDAIKDIFEDTRVLAEPAGALSLAGLKAWVARNGAPTGSLIAINTGANMNFDRLGHVAERANRGESREVLLAVTIPERPGSYRDFLRVLGRRSLTEFSYRYADSEDAHVFVGISVSDAGGERNGVIAELAAHGYDVVDLSANETAKSHLRYMVGGRARTVGEELILRSEFPERPGALQEFLDAVQPWNITLFHYRNHGADYGRVLMGLQVAPEDRARFDRELATLGYLFEDETDNAAYRLFLRG